MKNNNYRRKHSSRTKKAKHPEIRESGSSTTSLDDSDIENSHTCSRSLGTPTQTSSFNKEPTANRQKDHLPATPGRHYERSLTGMTNIKLVSSNMNKINANRLSTPTTSRTSLNLSQRDINGTPKTTTPRIPLNLNQRDMNGPPKSTTPRKQLVPLPVGESQESVFRLLEQLKLSQEESNVTLGQILRCVEANSHSTIKPENMPDFSLRDMLSFEDLDIQLENETHSTYLKNRLAAIGGATQRQSVMGMMRFLLSNELPMRFNWAGHNQKRSFKQTTLIGVIFEAAKVMFRGKHSSDKIITGAVQDWLKLAKNRHSYSTNKPA